MSANVFGNPHMLASSLASTSVPKSGVGSFQFPNLGAPTGIIRYARYWGISLGKVTWSPVSVQQMDATVRSVRQTPVLQSVRSHIAADRQESIVRPPRTYVDIKSVSLPDGRRRLFAMRGGIQILNSISDTELRSFSLEPGVRLNKSDFTAFEVISLHGPMVIRTSDDRYRTYLHLLITDSTSANRTAIVGATTPAS